MSEWNGLSMRERASYIRNAVARGILDVDEIRKDYHLYATGGNLYGSGGYRIPKNRKVLRTIKLNNGTLTAEVANDSNAYNKIYWFRNGKYITPYQMKNYRFYDSAIKGYRTLSEATDLRFKGKEVEEVANTPPYTPSIDDLKAKATTKLVNSNRESSKQSIPLKNQRMITLKTRGKMNLADIPENLLDSIAVNAGRSNTDFWTDAALIGKESTFGGISRALGNIPTNFPMDEISFNPHLLTNNHAYFVNPEQDYLNALYKYNFRDEGELIQAENNAKYALEHGLVTDNTPHYSKYVLADAFKRYQTAPAKYNPGLSNYVPMVNGIMQELKGEQLLLDYWNTKGKQLYKRGQQEGMAYGGPINTDVIQLGYNEFRKGGNTNPDSKKQVFLSSLELSLQNNSRYNTPQWRQYLTDLAFAESSFNPDSINNIGAKGYFQLMPANRAAKWDTPTQQFEELYRLNDSNMEYFKRNMTALDRKKAQLLGIDIYGLIAGAHLGGARNALRALRGSANNRDANGTSVMNYMRRFSQTSTGNNIDAMLDSNLPYVAQPDALRVARPVTVDEIILDALNNLRLQYDLLNPNPNPSTDNTSLIIQEPPAADTLDDVTEGNLITANNILNNVLFNLPTYSYSYNVTNALDNIAPALLITTSPDLYWTNLYDRYYKYEDGGNLYPIGGPIINVNKGDRVNTDLCATWSNGLLRDNGYLISGNAWSLNYVDPVFNGFEGLLRPNTYDSRLVRDYNHAATLNVYDNFDSKTLDKSKPYVVNMFYNNSPSLEIAYDDGKGVTGTHTGVLSYDPDTKKWWVTHNIHGNIYQEPFIDLLNNKGQYGVTAIYAPRKNTLWNKFKGALGFANGGPIVNMFLDGGETPLQYTHRRFPITEGLDVTPYLDPNFTPRDIGNYGDIEYMLAKYNTLPYYNNYAKPDSLKGKSVVVYNDRLGNGTNESVALDILSHGLRELDSYWRNNYIPELLTAFQEDANYFADIDNVPNEYRKEYIDSYIDGKIRNMVVDDNMRQQLNYLSREELIDEYMNSTPALLNALTEAYSYIFPTWLPEVTVIPNKHSLGGPIVDAANTFEIGGPTYNWTRVTRPNGNYGYVRTVNNKPIDFNEDTGYFKVYDAEDLNSNFTNAYINKDASYSNEDNIPAYTLDEVMVTPSLLGIQRVPDDHNAYLAQQKAIDAKVNAATMTPERFLGLMGVNVPLAAGALGATVAAPALFNNAVVPFADYIGSTQAGQLATKVLTNPYTQRLVESGFAAHGLSHAINEGINGPVDAAITALEVVPMLLVGKPIKEAVSSAYTDVINTYPALELYPRYVMGKFKYGFDAELPTLYRKVKTLPKVDGNKLVVSNPNNRFAFDNGFGEDSPIITNFTTDAPVRSHSAGNWDRGLTLAFPGKTLFGKHVVSTRPSDTFTFGDNITVPLKDVTGFTGRPKEINFLENIDVNTITSPEAELFWKSGALDLTNKIANTRVLNNKIFNNRNKGIVLLKPKIVRGDFTNYARAIEDLSRETFKSPTLRDYQLMDYVFKPKYTSLVFPRVNEFTLDFLNKNSESFGEWIGDWGRRMYLDDVSRWENIMYDPMTSAEADFRRDLNINLKQL